MTFKAVYDHKTGVSIRRKMTPAEQAEFDARQSARSPKLYDVTTEAAGRVIQQLPLIPDLKPTEIADLESKGFTVRERSVQALEGD